ncbi:hypothetical protein [Marivita sp.]|uniref:hypothetical protein n=1 Tax=Marivita sp. TaxID=2003365 RepID=UPI0025C6F996|nr:hypothetical protein [Marivita sp.]
MTNIGWLRLQIRNAKTMEQLKEAAINVDYDRWEGMRHMQIESNVQLLREEYAERLAELLARKTAISG